jgi:circadian clock protein KaiB
MAKRRKKSAESDIEQMIKRAGNERYLLRLYVTGSTPKSTAAISNIRSLLEEHLPGRYDLEVVDLYQQPAEAKNAEIIAAPTLIKSLPMPPKRMVGDLSDKSRVLLGLNLTPTNHQSDPAATKWMKL